MARDCSAGPAGHTLLLHDSQQLADTTVFASLIEKIKKTGIAFSGSVNAYKGYGSDENFRLVFDAGMTPNIKQGSKP